jgi:hypothetical protein
MEVWGNAQDLIKNCKESNPSFENLLESYISGDPTILCLLGNGVLLPSNLFSKVILSQIIADRDKIFFGFVNINNLNNENYSDFTKITKVCKYVSESVDPELLNLEVKPAHVLLQTTSSKKEYKILFNLNTWINWTLENLFIFGGLFDRILVPAHWTHINIKLRYTMKDKDNGTTMELPFYCPDSYPTFQSIWSQFLSSVFETNSNVCSVNARVAMWKGFQVYFS